MPNVAQDRQHGAGREGRAPAVRARGRTRRAYPASSSNRSPSSTAHRRNRAQRQLRRHFRRRPASVGAQRTTARSAERFGPPLLRECQWRVHDESRVRRAIDERSSSAPPTSWGLPTAARCATPTFVGSTTHSCSMDLMQPSKADERASRLLAASGRTAAAPAHGRRKRGQCPRDFGVARACARPVRRATRPWPSLRPAARSSSSNSTRRAVLRTGWGEARTS